jgi:hypothetical protein
VSDRENADPASNLFEAELGRQILVSERERASLQAVIGIGLLPIVGVVNAVYIFTASPLPAIKAAPADGGGHYHLRARRATVV